MTCLSTEEQIDAELDALSKHLAGLHHNIKDRPVMKYALESLPELIGARDYRNLCEAMGVELSVQPPTGEEFAEIVNNRVLRNELHRGRAEAKALRML